MSSSNTPHDLGYKYLFSHPDFVRDLVKGFIDDDWLCSLDYNTLERVSDSYVTDDLRARSDDVVWRVRAGGQWVYLYLLFEFQSSVDPHMALRMMVYTGLLYQDLVKRGQGLPQAGLPPVLPIVLYNGFRPWTAAHNIADLIPPLPEPMNGYIPQAKYLLIDENICADHLLPSWRNLVAAVFQFERPSSPEAIVELVDLLAIWLKDRPDLGPVDPDFAGCVGDPKGLAQGANRSWVGDPARIGNAAIGLLGSNPKGSLLAKRHSALRALPRRPVWAATRALIGAWPAGFAPVKSGSTGPSPRHEHLDECLSSPQTRAARADFIDREPTGAENHAGPP